MYFNFCLETEGSDYSCIELRISWKDWLGPVFVMDNDYLTVTVVCSICTKINEFVLIEYKKFKMNLPVFVPHYQT
jgi:hypothetical protein